MRCLALFTGGLDAQIAVRMMQRQGIDVIGLFVQTPFTVAADVVRSTAERLQIKFIAEEWDNSYLDIVRRPKFGYATEMAPCLDCRIGMLARARARMAEVDAAFVISGEVVGQRPGSLRSRDLETMAVHGGVDDLLLRPLSARLLPPTLPERSGWVNRELLHGWHGKGRREQIRLAREWGLSASREHLAGCLLLQELYARRLKRLLKLARLPIDKEIQTLSYGRHFALGDAGHIVVARNGEEASRLREIWSSDTNASYFVEPIGFRGPSALVFGSPGDAEWAVIAGLIAAVGKGVLPGTSTVQVSHNQGTASYPVSQVAASSTSLSTWQ